MNLAKTSVLSLIATVIKMISALVINKAIAIFVGPAGLAVIGQFQNFSSVIQVISTGGINKGVIKYTAEHKGNIEKRKKLWCTATSITIVCSIFISIIMVMKVNYLTEMIFKDQSYKYVLYTLSVTLFLYALNQLILSIINGLGWIKRYISINICQSIYSLFFTTILIFFYGLDGALIALVTNQSVVFIYVLISLRKYKDKLLVILKEFSFVDRVLSINLSNYALMAIVAALCAPISQFLIREDIIQSISIEHAGYWQAMNYISSMYLMVITTALSTYLLPKLSTLNNKKSILKELKLSVFFVLSISILSALIIYIAGGFLVGVLFEDSFLPMLTLFKWTLVGDCIKIVSWTLIQLLIAKALSKQYIILEVVNYVLLTLISMFMVHNFGFVGLSYAVVINHSLFLLVLLVTLKFSYFNERV